MKPEYTEKSIEFKADDFQLIQTDQRIMDTRLETKPTTFFRDALRRFRKNKSSVAGFFIVSVLILLAIIVPVASPHNITLVSTSEGFLAPKLFEAGTGFWDGTREKTHIVYDPVNHVPALSDKYSAEAIRQSLVSITVEAEPTLIDSASPIRHRRRDHVRHGRGCGGEGRLPPVQAPGAEQQGRVPHPDPLLR